MRTRVASGALDELVVFERYTEGAADAWGQVTGAWETLLEAWGDLRETLGREQIEAGRLEGNATATLRILWHPDAAGITSADRVLARGVRWNVRGQPIEVAGRNRLLEMKLERGVAVGQDLEA